MEKEENEGRYLKNLNDLLKIMLLLSGLSKPKMG